MIYCPQCGKELPDEAAFCDRCGHKVDEPVSLSEKRWSSRYTQRVGRRLEPTSQSPDYLDGVGFGVFLIAVAWAYLQYPWVPQEIAAWFKTWVNGPTFLPVILAEPIVIFFLIMGIWSLVEGGLRMVYGRVMRGLSNIVGALGSFAIAYIIRSYGQGLIDSSSLLPSFIIIIGASIVLSAIMSSFTWPPRRD